ncbi:hypothetical protein [Phycicoccus sp. Soil748]|uniref:hypothetical protein n=1 Tax=Phycicoccus sp. Soil748 TaxID=1736397 RepID=UPI000A3E12FE|nr:hypothetical protein [Phycicoccus sp. Soil748]
MVGRADGRVAVLLVVVRRGVVRVVGGVVVEVREDVVLEDVAAVVGPTVVDGAGPPPVLHPAISRAATAVAQVDLMLQE